MEGKNVKDVDASIVRSYWTRVAGAQIRNKRLDMGLTQGDLSNRVAQLGVLIHRDSISRIETGAPYNTGTMPSLSLDQFVAICIAMSVSPNELLDLTRLTNMATADVMRARWRRDVIDERNSRDH